jgi:membrane associated rhomboid family serine protease
MREAQQTVESLLELIAREAPGPWHPRLYVQRTGADPDDLAELVELAVLEKLIRSVEGSRFTGPGYFLTRLGEQALTDRTVLQRMQEGVPVSTDDPGAVVRASLRQDVKPVVTRLLLAANILVFLWGLTLSWKDNAVFQGFFIGMSGSPKVQRAVGEVLRRTGALSAEGLLDGQWWRLLSCAFVHGGIIHIGMNMYALINLGGFVEKTWGRWRLLVIYFVAAWIGSCLAMVRPPAVPLVGASGAICGLLGALAVWVVLYGRHLPRDMASRMRNSIIINIILITVMSMLPFVSWQAHLGGGVGGAAAALVLHLQRFGVRPIRWAALALLAPIVFGGWLMVNRAQALPNSAWQAAAERYEKAKKEQKETGPGRKKPTNEAEEEQELTDLFLNEKSPHHLSTAMQRARTAYEVDVERVVAQRPEDRNPAEVSKALDAVKEQRQKLGSLLEALEGVGPYKSETAEKARQAGRAFVQAQGKLLDLAQQRLEAGNKKEAPDQGLVQKQVAEVAKQHRLWLGRVTRNPERVKKQEQAEFTKRFLSTANPKRVNAIVDGARRAYKDQVEETIQTAPDERKAKDVREAKAALEKQRQKVAELLDALRKAGPYADEMAERARQAGRDYAQAQADLLDTARRCLDAGDAWGAADRARLQRQAREVTRQRGLWMDLLQ